MDWAKYRATTYDELIQADGQPRPAARRLVEYLSGLSGREIAERQLAADVVARVQGITFTVYSDGRNVDRTLPDPVGHFESWEPTALASPLLVLAGVASAE